MDVNQKADDGSTALVLACQLGRTDAVRALLEDPRVDVNLPDKGGRTALWWAGRNGFFRAMKWLLASSKEVNVQAKTEAGTTLLDRARTHNMGDLTRFLEEFRRRPESLRHVIRTELGFRGKQPEKKGGGALAFVEESCEERLTDFLLRIFLFFSCIFLQMPWSQNCSCRQCS